MSTQAVTSPQTVGGGCSCLPSKKGASALVTLITLVAGSVLLGVGLLKLHGVAAMATYIPGGVLLGISALSFLYFIILSCKKNKMVSKTAKTKTPKKEKTVKPKRSSSPKSLTNSTKSTKIKEAQHLNITPPEISIPSKKAPTNQNPWLSTTPYEPPKTTSPPPEDKNTKNASGDSQGPTPETFENPPEPPPSSTHRKFKIPIPGKKIRFPKAKMTPDKLKFQKQLAYLRCLMVINTIKKGQSIDDLTSLDVQSPAAPKLEIMSPPEQPEESSLTLYY